MNNQLPLSSIRNDLGKVFTPYTRELNSGIADALRNRNKLFEYGPGEDLPIKYDLLNGKPINDWDPITRMVQAFLPISMNLDYHPGREFLFRSGYDLRMSVMASPGPNSIDLSKNSRIRSKFSEAIGLLNLELELAKLYQQPEIIASLEEMEADIRNGKRGEYESKDYYHNKMIGDLFRNARHFAWQKIQEDPSIVDLINKEFASKEKRSKKTLSTSGINDVLYIYK